jgi:hypothetical protein
VQKRKLIIDDRNERAREKEERRAMKAEDRRAMAY